MAQNALPTLFAAALVIPFTLACAGSGGGGEIVRIDYSHVDGHSCVMAGGRPRIAYNEGEWDHSDCGTRATDVETVTGACRAVVMAECCDQIGAEFVGWQAFALSGEKLIGPLCRLP